MDWPYQSELRQIEHDLRTLQRDLTRAFVTNNRAAMRWIRTDLSKIAEQRDGVIARRSQSFDVSPQRSD
jgi:hypothetical protein